MIKKLIFILSILSVTGCAYYPSPASTHIIVSSAREVADCRLLGKVDGDAGSLWFSSVGVQVARDKAKDEAFRIGATNINILEENVRGKPYVVAKAYQCNFDNGDFH